MQWGNMQTVGLGLDCLDCLNWCDCKELMSRCSVADIVSCCHILPIVIRSERKKC